MTGDLPTAVIRSVQVGAVAPLEPDGVPSGLRMSMAAGRVVVRRLGLQADAQAGLTVHGGPDTVLYVFP